MRAVQLLRRNGQWCVHRAAIIQDQPDPSSKLESPAPLDPMRVRRILDQHDFHGTKVVCSLDPPVVALRQVTVPAEVSERPPSAWMPTVLRELREHLGVDVSHQQVRAWLLPPSRRKQTEAMAALAPTEQVTALAEALEQVKLCCVRVDVGAWALVTGGWAIHPVGSGGLWGILEVGHETSHLVMALGPTPLLHRTLGVGGSQFTRRVADRLKLDPLVAERLRHETPLEHSDRALRKDPSPPGQINPPSVGNMLHAAVRRELRILSEEIDKSFSYALDAYPNAEPAQLLLAGSGARWRGLDYLLGELLGIQVLVANPAGTWRPPENGAAQPESWPALVRALGLVVPDQVGA
jgi:Tfp pilus assembly PilM family ATPase